MERDQLVAILAVVHVGAAFLFIGGYIGTNLMTEVARVKQFGFGEAELDRARRGALAQYERTYNERNNTTSDPLASELLRHYLSREAVPGPDGLGLRKRVG